MTRELIILRHAVAEVAGPGGDFARRLTEMGLKDAQRAGRLIAKRGWSPDVILTSPAPRARQTCDAASEAMGVAAGRIQENAGIYEAAPAALRAILADLPSPVRRVLMVGHNPGLERLAFHLTKDAKLLRDGLAKAGVVWCRLPDDWRDLGPGCATEHRVVSPRDS